MKKYVKVENYGLPIVLSDSVKVTGVHGPFWMDENDILICIYHHAKVTEFIGDKRVVLNFTNYNIYNGDPNPIDNTNSDANIVDEKINPPINIIENEISATCYDEAHNTETKEEEIINNNEYDGTTTIDSEEVTNIEDPLSEPTDSEPERDEFGHIIFPEDKVTNDNHEYNRYNNNNYRNNKGKNKRR